MKALPLWVGLMLLWKSKLRSVLLPGSSVFCHVRIQSSSRHQTCYTLTFDFSASEPWNNTFLFVINYSVSYSVTTSLRQWWCDLDSSHHFHFSVYTHFISSWMTLPLSSSSCSVFQFIKKIQLKYHIDQYVFFWITWLLFF